jgi:hypothetical protein
LRAEETAQHALDFNAVSSIIGQEVIDLDRMADWRLESLPADRIEKSVIAKKTSEFFKNFGSPDRMKRGDRFQIDRRALQ